MVRFGESRFTMRTALIWEEPIAGRIVPQFRMFDGEVRCAERLKNAAKAFYASIGDRGTGLTTGEFRSPNWGFTGLPDFVPGDAKDKDPTAFWGTFKIDKVTDNAVSGTLRFSSRGLSVEGPFVAKRCAGRAP